MLTLWTRVQVWASKDRGASMVEYALLIVLVALIGLIAMRAAGRNISRAFSTVAGSMAAAMAPPAPPPPPWWCAFLPSWWPGC